MGVGAEAAKAGEWLSLTGSWPGLDGAGSTSGLGPVPDAGFWVTGIFDSVGPRGAGAGLGFGAGAGRPPLGGSVRGAGLS